MLGPLFGLLISAAALAYGLHQLRRGPFRRPEQRESLLRTLGDDHVARVERIASLLAKLCIFFGALGVALNLYAMFWRS